VACIATKSDVLCPRWVDAVEKALVNIDES